jgi:hypothetical protein
MDLARKAVDSFASEKSDRLETYRCEGYMTTFEGYGFATRHPCRTLHTLQSHLSGSCCADSNALYSSSLAFLLIRCYTHCTSIKDY